MKKLKRSLVAAALAVSMVVPVFALLVLEYTISSSLLTVSQIFGRFLKYGKVD